MYSQIAGSLRKYLCHRFVKFLRVYDIIIIFVDFLHYLTPKSFMLFIVSHPMEYFFKFLNWNHAIPVLIEKLKCHIKVLLIQ